MGIRRRGSLYRRGAVMCKYMFLILSAAVLFFSACQECQGDITKHGVCVMHIDRVKDSSVGQFEKMWEITIDRLNEYYGTNMAYEPSVPFTVHYLNSEVFICGDTLCLGKIVIDFGYKDKEIDYYMYLSALDSSLNGKDICHSSFAHEMIHYLHFKVLKIVDVDHKRFEWSRNSGPAAFEIQLWNDMAMEVCGYEDYYLTYDELTGEKL
jgi:hypothetical protein